MDIETATPPSQSYTILRIKRKRHEEPLDALVVESRIRRKKSRGGIDVFQYAQTLEHDAWEDEQTAKDLQVDISRKARETIGTIEGKNVPPPVLNEPSAATVSRQKEEAARRYTIIAREDSLPRFATAPPKVVSERELLAKSSEPDFKMYDAVPQARPAKEEDPSEMDKFMPMLTDYLKNHHITPSPSDTSEDKQLKPMSTSAAPSVGDDYVWDVFYHRPATLSEWNEAAKVGTLTGLPPSFGDFYDSASDSEEEDEADEDSNAEEYYKNEYPDEEEDDSDEFHESSDYDDMMGYPDNAEEIP